MRLHRLIGIILLIESRGIVKAKDLSDALEASERTIYRDIDILCEAGIPIVSIQGPSGGFSFMEGYKINTKELHADDVINLLLSGMGIRPQEYTESALSLKNAILKLENSVPTEYIPDIQKAKNRFFFDPNPWWSQISPDENLDLIRNAVWKSRKLKIKYYKNPNEESERTIRPYGLAVKSYEWYLVAYCEKRSSIRSFKCSRIKEAEMLNETFKIPDSFNLEEYWHGSIKSFVKKVQDPAAVSYPVKLSLAGEKNNVLDGFNVIKEYQQNEKHIYLIDLISFYTACTTLFGLSDIIEVKEPLELREYIIKKSQNILKNYKV